LGRMIDRAGSLERRERRILVTGGTGFIGTPLVARLLGLGYRVRLLYRPRPDRKIPEQDGLEPVPGDLLDPDSTRAAVSGGDAVGPLAGLIAAVRARELMRVNADGTEALARAARAAGVERFVLVSSLAAAGPGRRGEARTEASPVAPVAAYGRSKAEAEA